MSGSLTPLLKRALKDFPLFTRSTGGITLRRYQQGAAQAILDSVLHQRGYSFVVMFPRQSGKNELQAQIETYLLVLFSQEDAEIVKVSPTWKPQSLNAMRRLQRTLERNAITRLQWKKESGYIYRVGKARIFFLSGAPDANIVGATASKLLEVDEAQDVLPAKFDKDIAPMAASTNATCVFWGTAWTSTTLLARELRTSRAAQERDQVQRVFVCSAGDVSAEVPAYADFVAAQVARLGRNHPMVRSQFFSEEIDAEGGMFSPARRALMAGSHARQRAPLPGCTYALLLDVAGEDESAGDEAGYNGGDALANPGRDATALTVVEIDRSSLADPGLRAVTYRVVERRLWVGVRHTRLYAQLRALAETWRPARWVVDATGVGAGLASFLSSAFPGRVAPFTFNSATKSKLGWDFLAIVETGRFHDWRASEDGPDDEQSIFNRQLEFCQSTVLPGPDKRMKWGVPDGTRDPVSGELLHDDLLLSAALCAALEDETWSTPGGPAIVQRPDPLAEIDAEAY